MPALVLLACLACQPKQPLQPSFFTQPKSANASLDCKATLDCYAECQPLVEECMLRCDDRSSYYVVQRARAASNCVAQNGCADEACERERCGAEIDACRHPPPMQPPPPPPPPGYY